ncbi:hypothetical protein A2962_02325 [Candidatus Woesebacteria bacterium RIFCSPLOWO2_01_FULL_39_61]|uniref:Glycogen phosphorylase n=1 Tax=Candidatus Woesebacteria bacterium RIFCSPHIGHO2_02_FULL_39_13 TaxID=1802505 RepID=A0A1F7Z2W2_9BACT|nr:MAG: hypothetical protein A2692_01340 [Candidatus Woesebacteria bacterium RIFCSPHIGHO2_01_FULL_39_95]OGM33996.1 MAG: hypothetical protein A3D01_03630 [Candidatus Woesebacteria bacterium RIFCSPHIGHO2_02_FULL_39_13]OGM38254.1 MAG: hypothetical protein A3E13_05740 [Candidatus Woesebacteria bacterium RIFCSPHIGHO2_12_FULL_40_20]OGM66960.1 MAG: hypothetical protein A2962_02325 [Candidatus Woesebacteria bacterium RIFCSPLOWO2_01_FULL_39_61]OGM75508.1 MAG: hypothetical protein A3H19_00585 [Candidatus
MKLPELEEPVAYFCSEFALDNELPIYSGGLGILAADILNAAALQHYPMVGIGILYKGKEFMQHITADGKEEKRDSEFDHDTSFLRPTTVNGETIVFTLPLENQEVKVKSYHFRLSDKTIVFLLSTDIDGNPPEWINDMNKLYGGDMNSQLRQQILLGVGGVMLLNTLGIRPRKYHINEGRSAFLIFEETHILMKEEDLSFEAAWAKAKQKIVYTNHTLIAAGNPTYSPELVKDWIKSIANKLGVETESLIKYGLQDSQSFSITLFALNTSAKQSAVSKVHGEYARRDWPDYNWIAITNGVHLHRWQDSDYRHPDLTDQELWSEHLVKKQELVDSVIKRTGFGFDHKRLIISWARRLAEYKQPTAIFSDIQRLKRILSNPDRPAQLLFAGNSHSADPNAKSIIENIIKIFSKDLSGYAIFVPNYNISLANHLVSGSDIWLNTPKGTLEASGTSGMKALANGVLNCTVIDGWTYEVDWTDIGWTLDPKNIAESFYNTLENEILPLYYKRGADGLPYDWIKRMKKSIEISPKFSAERVLEDYKKYLYS